MSILDEPSPRFDVVWTAENLFGSHANFAYVLVYGYSARAHMGVHTIARVGGIRRKVALLVADSISAFREVSNRLDVSSPMRVMCTV